MKKFLMTTAIVVMASGAYAGNNNGPVFGGGDSNATANAGAAASAGASASVRNSNTNVNANLNSNRNTAHGGSARQGQGQLQGQGQRQSINGNNSSVVMNDRLQAPAVSAPSMSSGHPCQKSGLSFGLGIVGGGGSIGAGGAVDEACMLAQMGYKQAAMAMIAGRSEAARKALEQAGNIKSVTRPVARSTRSFQPEETAYTSCQMQDGKLRVGVRKGASDAVKARAVSQCRAHND